jgi:hypothetical protein
MNQLSRAEVRADFGNSWAVIFATVGHSVMRDKSRICEKLLICERQLNMKNASMCKIKIGSQNSRASAEKEFRPIEVFKIALDTRNFEINLFWQRCNYFLVLNSALAIGFFGIKEEEYHLPTAILGLIVCVLWFRVALGSKYWQSRWEQALEQLEHHYVHGPKQYIRVSEVLFSAPFEDVKESVKTSVNWSEHRGFARWIDDLVLTKPSVTLSMMVLVLTFAGAWGCLALYQSFKLIGLLD